MSFALAPQEGGSVRGLVASRSREPRDCDSESAKGGRKAQEAIEAIQSCAAGVRKEAQLLRAARGYVPAKAKVQEAVRVARGIEKEARSLLQTLPSGGDGSVSEQSSQRLRHQKLTESLVQVSSELEESWRAYEAAEAAAAHLAAASASAETSGSSAAASSQEPAGAGDLEAGRRALQLQELEQQVSQADVDVHASIVTEYAQQVDAVSQNMKEMRRALLDLAEHTRAQGELVGTIEQQMAQASDKTAGATQQMIITDRSQQKSMQRLLWMVFVAVLVAGATGFVAWRH